MTDEPVVCADCGEVITPPILDGTYEITSADSKPRHIGGCPSQEGNEFVWRPPPSNTAHYPDDD